jgi:hypothetical protein
MILRALAGGLAAVLLLTPAKAQDVRTATGTGAVVRVLDKINGETADLRIANGRGDSIWRMQVELGECRYPEGNPAGDAYAFLMLRIEGQAEPVFRGWMIASAPALNALDHPRYDVWVIRCTTS